MEAERAWSYSMQLKQEANTEPRKRFHLLSRLRKAAKHSENLEKLCESPRVDAKTKLEAQVRTGGRRCSWNGKFISWLQWQRPCCVFPGVYCISDWDGGVWAAGVEACHGGLQQVQVSLSFCKHPPDTLKYACHELIFKAAVICCPGPSTRSWPAPSLRRSPFCTASVLRKYLPTFGTVLTTLVSMFTGTSRSATWTLEGTGGQDSGVSCAVSQSWSSLSLCPWNVFLLWALGDQNAINDLMQMRLTGGGGGMMAEKLEVNMSTRCTLSTQLPSCSWMNWLLRRLLRLPAAFPSVPSGCLQLKLWGLLSSAVVAVRAPMGGLLVLRGIGEEGWMCFVYRIHGIMHPFDHCLSCHKYELKAF